MGTKRKGIPDKKHASHASVATEKNKKLFLKAVAAGCTIADAADVIGIARSTAYMWKKDDAAFDAQWDDAVETGLDRVETALFKRAIESSDSNAQFILSRRRPEIYGKRDTPPPKKEDEQAKLEDARQTLIQLGYQPRKIEGDYDEVDVAPAGNDADHS